MNAYPVCARPCAGKKVNAVNKKKKYCLSEVCNLVNSARSGIHYMLYLIYSRIDILKFCRKKANFIIMRKASQRYVTLCKSLNGNFPKITKNCVCPNDIE